MLFEFGLRAALALCLLTMQLRLSVCTDYDEHESKPSRRAFFIVFSPMLDAPDWPKAYEQYRGGVVVMNPFNATKATVTKVKTDLQVRVVMYWDTQDVQIKAKGRCLNTNPTKMCNDTAIDWTHCASGAMPCCYNFECDAYTAPSCPEDDFARALWDVFPQHWAVNDLSSHVPVNLEQGGTPICTYGKGPLTCHSNYSNAALVPFLSSWITSHGYDGVYFDEYFHEWTHTFSYRVDTDGDGNPDTFAQTQAQYNHFRPEFSRQLRVALGAEAIMIANSGVGQVDPSLNGLTIEACNDINTCISSFEAQAAVGFKPLLSVMWLKGSNPAECANAKLLREKLPYVLEGTDFFDGTHVVCNDSAEVAHVTNSIR